LKVFDPSGVSQFCAAIIRPMWVGSAAGIGDRAAICNAQIRRCGAAPVQFFGGVISIWERLIEWC
jgi:hypothetical protein